MKRYVLLLARLLIFAVVVWAAVQYAPAQWRRWFPQEKKESFIPTGRAQTGELVLSIKELGNVEAEKSQTVTSEIEGKMIFLIPEGKTVKAGDLLVRLDDTPLKEKVRTDTLAYNNAQSQVEKAKLEYDILLESNKTEVEQLEAQLNYDKAELERSKTQMEKKKRLAADRLIPQSEADLADIDVRSKEFNVTKGEKSLILKKKEVQSKENQKKADMQNVEFSATMAKSQLKESNRRLSKTKIFAPSGGLVVIAKSWTPDGRRKFKEGDGVYQQQQILQIPDLSSMLVKIQVDEADIARVRVGQRVRLSLDALPGKKFIGDIKDISNLATEAMPWETSNTPGRKNFEVTVKVTQSGISPLRPGMTANAEIITDTVAKCVYVPIEAVFEKEGKRLVYVKQRGTFHPRTVTIGKRNDNFVEIKSGLARGEVLALRDPTKQTPTPGEENGKKTTKPVPVPQVDKKKTG